MADDKNAQLILDAYKRHDDNPDWYAAQLANALCHTDDVSEAIALADIMYDANPTPPETTDDEEKKALEELGRQMSGITESDDE